MREINKASVNNVVLTLTEKVTITAPYYFLFEITNDLAKSISYCISNDTSAYTERYNEFSITETSTPIALNGEVSLSLSGFYKYKIYAQNSSTNLDPSLSDELVEQGKLFVNNEANTDEKYGATKYDSNEVYPD